MKKLSLFLVLTILGTSASSVFADDSVYENLILTVKNRVEVPEEYTEFDNLNQYEDNGEMFYSFMWKTEDGEHFIRVTCDSDGDISNYSKRQEAEEYAYLTMDSDKAKKTALAFIEKTNPELKGKIVLELNAGYSYGGLDFTVTGVFNGIEYYKNIGSVTVADDMTVTSMYVSAPDIGEETVNCITEAEAYKLYMDNIGVETEYYTYSDTAKITAQNDDKLISFPVYSDVDYKAIDAITGEVIEFENYTVYNTSASMGSNVAESAADGAYKELTDSEKENLVELNNLLTKEAVLKIFKDRTGIDFMPVRTHLRNSGNKNYYYTFSNDTGNFSVNANNGDITSLYLYFEKGENDTSVFHNYNLDDEQSANKLIELLAPVDGSLYEVEENTATDARLVYKVNGIKLNSPRAYFSMGTDDSYYSFSITALDRYKNTEYAEPEKFIPTTELFSDTSFVKLKYIDTAEGIKAAYLPDTFFVNAITGKSVNSRNEENTGNTPYTYSDIENHWVKTVAERLAYGGIGFYGGILQPDKSITSSEAYDLLNKLYYKYSEEITYANQMITRQEAVSLIVDRLGLSKLSESDIFKQPYTDVTENYGAIAILKGYGIIAGDTDTFRPDDNITRAEFLQMLYNTLLTR